MWLSLPNSVLLLQNLYHGLGFGTSGGVFVFDAYGAGASTRYAFPQVAISPYASGGMLPMNPHELSRTLLRPFQGINCSFGGISQGSFPLGAGVRNGD